MALLRKILFPFSLIYALIVSIRNFLFDQNIFKSVSYKFPVICIGNLSVGGTGKTPMIEYLIRLLRKEMTIATLSRGYKRQSKGFLIAEDTTTVQELGDEPFQYFKKYNDIIVSVDANRREGISRLRDLKNSPEAILLDDAFQHRKVTAGLNILLTVYNDLYVDDFMLPTGNLRDNKREAKRADAIVVTKCPENLNTIEKEQIIQKIKPGRHQKVFFSSIRYDDHFYSSDRKLKINELKKQSFTLITGIANPSHLIHHLKAKELNFEHLNFKDHHHFSEKEIEKFKQKEIIVTTEKDYVRLYQELDHLYYLPIETYILFDEAETFDKMIIEFVENNNK
ncbi:tetraacyldisaccharide 4'-kinase [Flavobacteriaceae bacterium R38]|nr:tetraacyldisaccharide 4'-kinase [Flavobacteriaceae bacterium R38]